MPKSGFNLGNDVPDKNLMGAGNYEAKIVSAKADAGESDSKGRLILKLEFRLTKPKSVLDQPFFDNLYLGNEDDPLAEDPHTPKGYGPGTSGMAWSKLKKLVTKCGFDPTELEGSGQEIAEQAAQNIQGEAVGLAITVQLRKDKDTKQLTGDKDNRVDYFEIGEKDPEVFAAEEDGSVSGKKKMGKKPTRSTEEEEEEVAPVKKAKAKPKPEPEEEEEDDTPKKKGKKAPPPEDDEDEEGEDEDEEDEEEDEKPKNKKRPRE